MVIPPETSYTGSSEEIARLKAELTSENYLAMQAKCVRAFGPEAGIFARQLIYFTGKSALEDGWLWKTEAEMEEETGLSRSRQRKARKVLTSVGVLEEKRMGVPYRMHFRVNLVRLVDLLKPGRSVLNQSKIGTKLDKETSTYYRPEAETLNLDSRQAANTCPSSEAGTTSPSSEAGTTSPTVEAGTTDRAIHRVRQETTAERTYRDSSLQAGERDLSGHAADEDRVKPSASQNVEYATRTDNGIRPDGLPSTPDKATRKELDGKERNRVWYLLLEGENDVTAHADLFLNNEPDANGEPVTLERVAEEVRAHLGGSSPLEAYTAWVVRFLEQRRKERSAAFGERAAV